MKIVSMLTTGARGGAEFAVVDLLEGLAGLGHEAVLLTNQARLPAGTAIASRPIELGPKFSRPTRPQLASRWPRDVARLRAALAREAPHDALQLHFNKEQLMGAHLGGELCTSEGAAGRRYGVQRHGRANILDMVQRTLDGVIGPAARATATAASPRSGSLSGAGRRQAP